MGAGDRAAELLTRTYADPAEALAAAEARLPGAVGVERAELLRVMGNACRELRRVDEAVAHLSAALAEAQRLDDPAVAGRMAMSLAAALTYSGDLERAVELAGRAVGVLAGSDLLAARSQLAGVLQRAGRHDDALAAYEQALAEATALGDESFEADLRCNRGVLLGFRGQIAAAETDTQRALELYERLGWSKGAADVRHNLAWLAGRRGDLVEAFHRFDEAEAAYAALGLTGAAVFPDRCEALLAAGLDHEALALAERSTGGLRGRGDDVDLAEALMLVARAALLAGDPVRAEEAAAEALARFERQSRAGWWAAAAALLVEARMHAGTADGADVARVAAVIEATAAAGLVPAVAEAHLVGAELGLAIGDPDVARRHAALAAPAALGVAARCRLALVRARLADLGGDALGSLAMSAATVDEFAELTAYLGGTELRAHVARHVADLVAHGLALAVRAGDPALALAWSERVRASALDAPPVRPPDDDAVAADLDLLRAALTALDAKARDGVAEPADLARAAELQERVRRRTRLARRAAPDGSGAGLDPSAVTGTAWVSFVELGDRFAAVRVVDGRAEVVELGPAGDLRSGASSLAAMLTMHLNAVGRGRARDPAPVLAAAAELDGSLLAPLDLPPGSVVVSPVGGLHDVPWGLLPGLAGRPFAVAPSIALWRRCRAVDGAGLRRAVAVAGPDLPLAADEAAVVAGRYAEAVVLAAGDATVAAAGAALAAADVAHLACHGRFAADNPMFSSLRLADGPMFVHDLERIAPAPRIVVLSACHAGTHATPTGREVLGLTASLLARGPRAVLAATVPIPDTVATVELMGRVHAALAAGAGPAAALLDARRADPVIGGAFACHGAG